VLHYRKEKGIDNGTDDDDYFMSAVKDKNGELWMSTYGAGVWRYDGKKMSHYPVMAGNTPITVFAIYKDNQDALWLGTHEHGVYKFNGKTFEKFRP
jgi:ligand-binding sensor domain-containing protein